MIIIAREIIEDIHPRYPGDTIRRHIISGTFPRRVTEITFYEDDERVPEYCPECRRNFTVKARIWARMKAIYGYCPCYACLQQRIKSTACSALSRRAVKPLASAMGIQGAPPAGGELLNQSLDFRDTLYSVLRTLTTE